MLNSFARRARRCIDHEASNLAKHGRRLYWLSYGARLCTARVSPRQCRVLSASSESASSSRGFLIQYEIRKDGAPRVEPFSNYDGLQHT
jgi:hypothetical protein